MPLTATTAAVAQVVKQETAFIHQEVEQLLLPKLIAIKSPEDYAAILRAFYGFYQPIELTIQQHISTSVLPDIKERRTASLILDDLDNLGMLTGITTCTELPEISNTAQAFGVLYVLEGSTLGGKMIAKMLAKNQLFPVPFEALNFFNGYKEATGIMWTDFVKALNQQADSETIIYAANQTFYHLKNWMQEELYGESKK